MSRDYHVSFPGRLKSSGWGEDNKEESNGWRHERVRRGYPFKVQLLREETNGGGIRGGNL